MKNLINALNTEAQKQMDDFKTSIANTDELNTWYYTELMPKGSKRVFATIDEKKAYLLERKQKQLQKWLSKQIERISLIANAPDFISLSVQIDWIKSKTWGNNPQAVAKVCYADHSCEVFTSSRIGGCGYDKESTAFAEALSQSNSLLKLLYTFKDANINTENRELFGYGSGYGILPRLEGGVGVSCFYRIFEKLGYKMSNVASGKTFDAWQIVKL